MSEENVALVLENKLYSLILLHCKYLSRFVRYYLFLDKGAAGDDDGSDSDFGDWDQDNWTSVNDNVTLPTRDEATKTSRINAGV